MTTSTINVLHVIGSAGFGGGERYLLDLIRFSSDGKRHIVVMPQVGPMTEQMETAGNDYRIIAMPRIPSLTGVIRLLRLCHRKQVDIIHSHGYRANLYGRLLALLCRKPHVATIHVSLYDYLETPPVIRQFYRLVEKWTAPVTRRFICISEAMANDIRMMGVDPGRIAIIENGTDVKRFSTDYVVKALKRKFEIQSRYPVIGTVGRLVTEKGQAFLIEALTALKSDFPDLVCLFVGEGPLLEALQQQAMSADVMEMCRFTGPVAEIDEIYAMLDLFVLPSLREPFGLAVLEAMASGIAVLATDAGGPAEYIRTGLNGLLVPPGRPWEMAGAIRTVLSDRSLREKIATAGRQTAIERFDIRETVRRIEDVYASL